MEDEVRVAMIAVLPSVSLGLVACGADPVRRTVTRGRTGASAGAGMAAVTVTPIGDDGAVAGAVTR